MTLEELINAAMPGFDMHKDEYGTLVVSPPDPDIEYIWTFERGSEVFDGEFKTKKEAQTWADNAFAEECQEENLHNGETFQEEIYLIRRYADGSDFVEVERIKSEVYYEHYHGDYVEHFSQKDYL